VTAMRRLYHPNVLRVHEVVATAVLKSLRVVNEVF
jgi:hypothetical protein